MAGSCRLQPVRVESGRKIDGQETLGGLRFAEKTLQEGESCEYTLLIGAIQGEENIARIRVQFSDSGKVSSSLKETRQYWKRKIKYIITPQIRFLISL